MALISERIKNTQQTKGTKKESTEWKQWIPKWIRTKATLAESTWYRPLWSLICKTVAIDFFLSLAERKPKRYWIVTLPATMYVRHYRKIHNIFLHHTFNLTSFLSFIYIIFIICFSFVSAHICYTANSNSVKVWNEWHIVLGERRSAMLCEYSHQKL